MAGHVRAFVGRFGRAALLDRTPTIAEHAHAQTHALVKVSGDDTVFVVDGHEQLLDDASIVLVDPWVVHAGRPAADGARLLALYIAPFWFDPSVQAAIAWGRRPVFRTARATIEPATRAAVDRVLALMLDDGAADDALDHACDRLFRNLIDAYGAADLGEIGAAALRPTDFRIRRAIAHLRERPGNAIDIDACAALAGLSRSRFFELFRSCTGVSPRMYANALSIEAAIEMLGTSNDPIHAIADRLGFSAPSHFTRFFLQHLGSTPRAFRTGVRHRQAS